MKKAHLFPRSLMLFTVVIIFSSCEIDQLASPANSFQAEKHHSPSLKAPKGTFFYGLNHDNQITGYTSGNPLTEHSTVTVTGLQAGEILLAIDYRPATGQLYAVTNMSRLYVIDPVFGSATAVSMTPFTPAISGTRVGFDFNPTVDRIRLVTDGDQNLRLHPVTGVVAAVDVNLNPADPMVVAAGYTNSFAGATTTTLYDINVTDDMLYKQLPPNNGTLVPVGPLGLQVTGEGGLDISPDNSVALAVLYGRGDDGDEENEISNGNKTRFYYIDLSTGAATNAGKTDRSIIGLAIPPASN